MNYTREAVIDYVANKIHAYNSNIFVTSEKLYKTATFPAVEIRLIDKARPRRNITLAYDDEQNTLTFTVQVYCDKKSGGLGSALALMGIIETTFNELYFIETTFGEVENEDPSISRVVARFSRQVGNGDDLPQISNENEV